MLKAFGSAWRKWRRKIGWGGRIRTFTVLINSEVSYQLDHAPAEGNCFEKHAGNAGKALGQKIVAREGER